MKRIVCLIFPILALLCSCEDVADDYRYPSVITDYACLITEAEGRPKKLNLDNGCTYPIEFTDEYNEAYEQQPTYQADTVYRVITIYELAADSVAYVYSMAPTVSFIPSRLRDGEVLRQDPVYLQSCWCSGGYLNVVIGLKALDGRHSVDFIDTTPDDMAGKEFTFYHNANGDVEAYRQNLYGSIPLAPFERELQQGDTLRLVVNEYDKGITKYEFVL